MFWEFAFETITDCPAKKNKRMPDTQTYPLHTHEATLDTLLNAPTHSFNTTKHSCENLMREPGESYQSTIRTSLRNLHFEPYRKK